MTCPLKIDLPGYESPGESPTPQAVALALLRAALFARQESVQVAMAPVRVVESAGDVVVQVIAVRDSLVLAGFAVLFAALDRCAQARPFPVHFEPMLVEMALVGRVQVPIMEVVRVVAVAHGLVAAARPVLVRVTLVLAAGHVGPPRASSLASASRSTARVTVG